MFKAAASLAVGCAMLSTSAFAALTGSPALSNDRSAVNVTVSGVGASKESTILVLKGARTEMPATINEDDIVYINQQTADGNGNATYSMPLGTRVGDATAVTVFAGATDESAATLLGSVTLASAPDRDFITGTVEGKATVKNANINNAAKAFWYDGFEVGSRKARIVLDSTAYTGASTDYMIKVVDNDGNDVAGTEMYYSVEGNFFVALIPSNVVTAGYKFEVLTGSGINTATQIAKFGDVAAKIGTLNLLDANAVVRAIRNNTAFNTNALAISADVTFDGNINLLDANAIVNKVRSGKEFVVLTK